MTEKNYNPKQKEKKAMANQGKVSEAVPKKPVEKSKPKEEPKKVEGNKSIDQKTETNKKDAPKKNVEPKKKVKKDKAVVNATSLPISTKYAVEMCRFIKNKPIKMAINELEEVLTFKRAIPMRGEYGHKKGAKMAGGKYPKKATEHFIKILKSLSSNSIANNMDNPIIGQAMANQAQRPAGRFGRWQRKRTHVSLVAIEKKDKNSKKKSTKKTGAKK